MQDALNAIWNIPPRPPRNVWRSLLGIFQDRAMSFVMVLASGVILTVSLAISMLLTTLDPLLQLVQPHSAALLTIGDLFMSFIIVTLLFVVLYRILPETRVTWRDVWLGALSAALLFTVGKFALSLYFDEIQCYTHILSKPGVELNFGNTPEDTKIRESDFEFRQIPVEEYYKNPGENFTIIFLASRPKSASALPNISSEIPMTDYSFTREFSL